MSRYYRSQIEIESGYTSRTIAFASATGITDITILGALNTFDLGLISNGLDSKMKAVYPFVGGTSSTHKYNFFDPRDLDVAFRLSFYGGWVHSSNGGLPNGVNTYADTFFNQTTNFNSNSNASIGCYLRTNNSLPGADMGAGDSGNSKNGMLIYASFNGTYYGCAMGDTFIAPAPSNTDSRGFYVVNRNSNVQSLHKRGDVTINNYETEVAGTIINENIWVGGGTLDPNNYGYSWKQTAFNFIGDSLTQAQIDTLYNLVQTMQTTLGRQI